MTNNIQPLDHWHHQYLLGNQEALPMLQGLLRAGIKSKCPQSLRIAESLKKKPKFKWLSQEKLRSIENITKPLYLFFYAIIMGLAIVMLFSEGGYYVL